MKHRVFKLGLLLLLVLITWIVFDWPSGQLEIVFCDVGQGDAILINQGFFQVLVDGGPDDSVQECLAQNIPFWDKTLEMLIITHPDNDHISGLEGVLAKYEVKATLISDWKQTKTAQNLRSLLKKESLDGMKLKEAILGNSVGLPSGGLLQVLYPFDQWQPAENVQKCHPKASLTEMMLSDSNETILGKDEDANHRSIVLLLSLDQYDLLLMGDAPQLTELALIKNGLIKRVEGIKIGHHGSKTSSSPVFLQLVRPEICIISCGSNNSFNHPDPQVLSNLNQAECRIKRTDQKGSVKIITNGFNYKVLQID